MIKSVFVSGSDIRIINALNKLGIKTVPVIKNILLDLPVSTHADCAAFRIGNTIFAQSENADLLSSYGSETVRIKEIRSPYPNDVRLNAKLFGKNILCNKNYIDDKIKAYAERNSYGIIHCNQGYAACSTVKINDSTAITDDITVYNSLVIAGIDCLLVEKGSIGIVGYDYGFIGGCCGMISDDILAFAGDYKKHKDWEKIEEFLNKNNVEPFSLFDDSLIDFGGFIVLE